ncbi:alpha/beta hydrolase [Actinopolyspora halophila]|uniref:alpha/beta hydrolase n=1 Tax=Actinopolyspora halophila TaxID=1850 RepID=UPI0003674DC1|nr:alpha/beta fold hydrolase [Actinopolyspora halophila]
MSTSTPSPTSTTDTVFVLVHGAWHSSAQWAHTQRALAGLGASSVAVDLPGHGLAAPLPAGYLDGDQPRLDTETSALAGLSLNECAETILSTLRAVRRHRNVVLVAHSAGGAPASLAAELAPELVDRTVYLSAFCPAGRPRFIDYLDAPEQVDTARGRTLPVGDAAALGAIRINPLSRDPEYVEELRLTHYTDTPAEEFGRWRLALSPDLPIAIPSTPVTVTRQRWGRIPRTFIRCAADLASTPAMQDLMIAEADSAMPDNPFTVHSLPGGHSPFAARPAELATVLTR